MRRNTKIRNSSFYFWKLDLWAISSFFDSAFNSTFLYKCSSDFGLNNLRFSISEFDSSFKTYYDFRGSRRSDFKTCLRWYVIDWQACPTKKRFLQWQLINLHFTSSNPTRNFESGPMIFLFLASNRVFFR